MPGKKHAIVERRVRLEAAERAGEDAARYWLGARKEPLTDWLLMSFTRDAAGQLWPLGAMDRYRDGFARVVKASDPSISVPEVVYGAG